MDDFADQGGTIAVNAPVTEGDERLYALSEERDLHQRVAVPSQGQHGLNRVRRGHAEPSIDPVPKIGRRTMEERMSDVQNTGTLPISGSVPDGATPRSDRPAWLQEARGGLTVPGKYLAYEESGRHVVAAISREWTRIGRSLAADIRFDDATVSRRHALVVSQAEGVRVLDDRSLNGIYVNGRRVEWSPLADGDEVTIGRHTLYFMDTATVGSAAAPAPATTAE
jgi:hypothetical protein